MPGPWGHPELHLHGHELKTWLPGDSFLFPPNISNGFIPLAPENAAMAQLKSQDSVREKNDAFGFKHAKLKILLGYPAGASNR